MRRVEVYTGLLDDGKIYLRCADCRTAEALALARRDSSDWHPVDVQCACRQQREAAITRAFQRGRD